MSWYPIEVPPLAGRRVLITGANAGLGFFTAARLAGAGAFVVLSGRNPDRLAAAVAAIRSKVPDAALDTLLIDTASLQSVEGGADDVLAGPRLDALVLNAGTVHPPASRMESIDGNELVLATNVLGHFALLARVLPHVADGGRIVHLGSLSTRLSTFRVDDLQLRGGYDPWRAYAHSKIATQVVGFELDRRLRQAAGGAAPRVHSVVAHPGYSLSGLTPRIPGVNEPTRRDRFADQLARVGAQGKHRGAEVVVHAASAHDVEGGQNWAPRFGLKGAPVLATPTRTTTDPAVAAKVWAFAEDATGLEFAV